MIPFNKPPVTGTEIQYINDAIANSHLSGDGPYGKKCQLWFEEQTKCLKALLTPSCTAALEMAAILIDIQPGDEVIMPSYTFVSTANSFVLRGAKIVFVDIHPDTMNINENLIEQAITEKTKAIVPVHYAGVACEMDLIMSLAKRYNLFVIEDAAQGMMSTYKGKPLGSIGHLGAYSFHETKNYTSGGEGGLLLINDEQFVKRAEIIREKGTNRSQFFRGMVDKYSWVDIGSSYLPSELQAAYLWAQLKAADEIKNCRLVSWERYREKLHYLDREGLLELPVVPENSCHNGHMFYIKVKDISVRESLIYHLKSENIMSAFHYVPLHSAYVGEKFGRFNDMDRYTTQESERLLRLPLYYGLEKEEQDLVVKSIGSFFSSINKFG
ncbi:dTDP-4-amino-4,6-dideoxygalactose transaminase [Aliivibrio fischeri]|uniref:dTDP-4-amino-4,6-dideoxygalactose transaminase n=1 Tax=Aliivibrio fischeri TaxID=668 RepID=UPI0007C570D6|nr:dTDP-4-amino-4,6-dideoxygalactose transaminase [Aliivibrio fischeri]MBP3140695.1 dTDP-4-amino-4,6-dideoxygalactose transaminase [Aliivibrio fischeri]MBP3155998.1 dTDP-4-amino-4,6-dideoxygalactose transaminase [Aliivibrio fischeri]MCE7574473.1 dTDP-4-amino-4,6-dideoxygalactose transaminase [Aliivibrio fischeri]